MKKLILCSLLLFIGLLSAETLHLSITYLGLKVVDVQMIHQNNLIQVKAQASGIASIASSMDNFYESIYLGDFLPFSYRKIIHQKDYQEDRLTTYSRDTQKAFRNSYISPDRTKEYPIHQASRDFFSALYYIRFNLNNSADLYIDANGLIWKAHCQKSKPEMIKTSCGKQLADKITVTFQKLSDQKKDRSDMLTNNLVSEDSALILWLSRDSNRLPIKAKFELKPFAVYWKLDSFEK